eukprot:6455927-Amphidinium_carterae.1
MPGEQGVAARGAVGGVPGPGLDFPGAGRGLEDVTALMREVNAIRDQLLKEQTGRKKKKKKKKKKTGHRRGSSSSSSKDSDARERERSRQRRHSSSSSSSTEEKFMVWTAGRGRKVTVDMETRVEQEKFKTRSDLIAFASKHPGALSAHFLNLVHQKLNQGRIHHSTDLHKVNVSQWATQFAGLSEVRDQREAQTLAAAMDRINRNQLAEAMDLIAQRLISIQKAKASKGSSWEKSEALELIAPQGNVAAASSMLRLAA